MPTKPLKQGEFIALIAMLFATIAFSIDSMLPSLPVIAEALTPDDPNRAQLILTMFIFGMGVGTLFSGPLSDRFGRRATIIGGGVIYSMGALAAYLAPTLETLLIARLVQGLGAAGPRVAAMALVRDLYSGRQMARVMSFVMVVFTLVPALAPLLGSGIIAAFGWRAVFLSFIVFSAVSVGWMVLRQPETLPPEMRRSLQPAALWRAMVEVLRHPTVRMSIMVQTLVYGCLFANLSASQQVFDITYGRGETFALWFAVIAIVAATASILNARIVVRVGMRRLVTIALCVQMLASIAMALVLGLLPASVAFYAYLIWCIGVFFMTGLTIGNLNAIAMEPMGHIAGMAASVTSAVSTVASVALAVPVGLAFNGTPVPLMIGVAGFAGLGWILMRWMPK